MPSKTTIGNEEICIGTEEVCNPVCYRGREGYDPPIFLSDVMRDVTNLLESNRKSKVKLILMCNLEKTNIADGETIQQPAAFHSDIEVTCNLEGTDVNE